MCVFCSIVKGDIPSYKVYEDDVCLAILDISQVTKGHTLVLSKKHYANLLEADPEDLKHMITVIQKLANELKVKLNAQGVNVLQNNGAAAGQTVEHLHFHIIPRYSEADACTLEFKESGIKAEEVAKELGL